jgi:AcrR family transcriptional regulator
VLNSIEDTRKIFDKVGKLFRKFGIKSITMDDISGELGISKKTLYQLISDKAELVEMVFMNGFNDFKNEVMLLFEKKYDPVLELIRLNNLALEQLKEFGPAVEHDLRKYYNNLYEKIKKLHLELMQNCIYQNIELGKKTGIYRNNIDTNIITKLHLARIEQVPHTDIFTLEEYTSPDFAREVCRAHLKGLVSEKGQELLEQHINELNDKNK